MEQIFSWLNVGGVYLWLILVLLVPMLLLGTVGTLLVLYDRVSPRAAIGFSVLLFIMALAFIGIGAKGYTSILAVWLPTNVEAADPLRTSVAHSEAQVPLVAGAVAAMASALWGAILFRRGRRPAAVSRG